MEITALQRCQAPSKRFRVCFDDGTELNVPAADLQTFERFQRAVLAATGNRYRGDQVKAQPRAFDRAAAWLADITVAMQYTAPLENPCTQLCGRDNPVLPFPTLSDNPFCGREERSDGPS
jgi:hypothetical protein